MQNNNLSQNTDTEKKRFSPAAKIGIGVLFAVLGILCFSALAALISEHIGKDSVLFPFSVIFGIVLLGIGGIYVFLGVRGLKKRSDDKDGILTSRIEDVDKMDGITFEKFLAALYGKFGYEVDLTRITGDFGVDLILTKDDETITAQAKCYKNKVSLSAVQEIAAAKQYYKCNNAWVVTNNYFTAPAVALAESNNVILIDRNILIKTMNAVGEYVDKNKDNRKTDLNTYNGTYSDKLLRIRKKIRHAYEMSDFDRIIRLITLAGETEKKSDQNYVLLHFFYNDVINRISSLNTLTEERINYFLGVCRKDMDMIKHLQILRGHSFPTLSWQATIYENSDQPNKALDICNFGIKYRLSDNGQSFRIRKQRITEMLSES